MNHLRLAALAALASIPLFAAPALAQDAAPLRVFLRGGEKTHGPGQHDHPKFVAEWSKLLASRGARVAGALRFPTAEELARTDVLVIYAADGGSIHGDDRAHLEAYLARGGGIVVIHDGICGDDPQWFKTVVGGAWEHGHSKWHEGEIGLYMRDRDHPITRGVANFDFKDEIYTDLHMQPEAHVLACGFEDVFNDPPQMWTYEKDAYRAFVSIQGHEWTSFENPAWRALLLRGIAWAGKRDVDLLTTAAERDGLGYPVGGPTAPALASKSMRPNPDFDLSLVAAEPLVVNPISIDWDASGRMWVAQTPGYPMKEKLSKEPAHDSIVVLSDTNGDGRMDASRTFADKLDLVTSFVFHEDGVIASASPDILWLRDTDGDGVADAREVLYTGFGFGDTHAVVSNLRWGLDGWIYATQGYSGNDSKDVHNDTKHFGRIGNGLFRFKPDGSAIEMVSSYGSNTWGLDFDWDGELFFSMANGAHLRHVVVPERALAAGRLPGVETWADLPDHDRVFPIVHETREPYVQIDFVGGFTAASGCCIYNGGAWPKQYWGTAYVCEPSVHIVHQDVLAPKGATFTATKAREEEFLAGSDIWFRPVHTRVGPDGALYVLDFYNQAVVHNDTRGPKHGPTNAALRPDRDHQHGRIWRMQHKQAEKLAQPNLAGANTAQLVAAFEHPNAWQRTTAQRLLCERPAADAKEALFAMADAGEHPYARALALWTIGRTCAAGETRPLVSKRPTDPGVLKALIETWATLHAGGKDGSQLAAEARVGDERMALLAVQAIGELGYGPAQARELVVVYDNHANGWTRSAIVSAMAADPVGALEKLLTPQRRFQGSPLVVELAGLAARQGRAIPALILLSNQESDPDGVNQVEASLLRMQRELKADDKEVGDAKLTTALAALLSSKDVEIATAALPFAVRWDREDALKPQIQALGARLEQVALDGQSLASERLAAFKSLLAIPERRSAALKAADMLLDPLQPPEVQLAVIDELGRSADDGAAVVLAHAYPSLGNAAREQAFARVLERPRWTAVFLDEVQAKRIALNDLGPHKLAQLRNHPDAPTAQKAAGVLDALQGAGAGDVDALVAKLMPIVQQPGDVAHGKELFTQNCATCHTFHGAGGNVGPGLDGIGSHGAKALLPVILDPNRTVEAAFVEYVARTSDERVAAGVLVRETAESVVLRSSAGEVVVPREELESLRSTGRSPMPTGFEALGAEGLRDVLAYLASGTQGYALLDLRTLADASTATGMYDTRYDANPMKLSRTGVIDVDGVPFEVLDPRTAPAGKNVLVLQGGRGANWQSKSYPAKVEVAVGQKLARLHVLGGIAAWGYPCSADQRPICKLTWRFADGSSEDVVLHDGVEFADWIGRRDVPGSRWVPDLVPEDSAGQVRVFSVAPPKDVEVASIALESLAADMAPTFLALTAELPGAKPRAPSAPVTAAAPAAPANGGGTPVTLMLFGGGSSHDFSRWFGDSDLATLGGAGFTGAQYTELPADVGPALAGLKVLVLSTNQPLTDPELRQGVMDFVARGGGLVLVHPAMWVNWPDWPAYNRQLVGGGTKSHENYAPIDVRIVDAAHPLAKGVPATFAVDDELYRFEPDPKGAEMHVVAVGKSRSTGLEYPVVWTVARPKGRTACITLGHDESAHHSAGYRALLSNAVRWMQGD